MNKLFKKIKNWFIKIKLRLKGIDVYSLRKFVNWVKYLENHKRDDKSFNVVIKEYFNGL